MKQTTYPPFSPNAESSPHMDAYNERETKRRSRHFSAPTESSSTIPLHRLTGTLQHPDQPLMEEESYRTRCISEDIDRETYALNVESTCCMVSPVRTPLDYEQEPKAPVHLRTISNEVLQDPMVNSQIPFPDSPTSPKQSEEELRASYKRRRRTASAAFGPFSSASSQDPELKSKKRRRLNRNLALGGEEFDQILSQIAMVGGI
jgi:hypothetical protein